MLNIGRLATGGEDYYLATVATEVADYYAGRGEALAWRCSATIAQASRSSIMHWSG